VHHDALVVFLGIERFPGGNQRFHGRVGDAIFTDKFDASLFSVSRD
jgi:hypothetical protein